MFRRTHTKLTKNNPALQDWPMTKKGWLSLFVLLLDWLFIHVFISRPVFLFFNIFSIEYSLDPGTGFERFMIQGALSALFLTFLVIHFYHAIRAILGDYIYEFEIRNEHEFLIQLSFSFLYLMWIHYPLALIDYQKIDVVLL